MERSNLKYASVKEVAEVATALMCLAARIASLSIKS